MNHNNSRRKFLRTTAVATVGLSLIGGTALANSKTNTNFPGYSSLSDARTDFRGGLKLNEFLEIKGRLLSEDTLLPVANAKIEVWFQVKGKPWKMERGHFFTDQLGHYSFKADWPGHKKGQKARIYFKATKSSSEKFGLLCLDSNFAYVHGSHWESHNMMGDQVFPTMKKHTLKKTINFNLSI